MSRSAAAMAASALVVIGNGMAAARLVDELTRARARPLRRSRWSARSRGSPITACCCRSVLAGEVASSEIELKPRGWWRERGVTLLYGCRATAIDTTGAHASTLRRRRDAAVLDSCVFATGSQPIRPAAPRHGRCRASSPSAIISDICDHLAARRRRRPRRRDRRRPARARGGLWPRARPARA